MKAALQAEFSEKEFRFDFTAKTEENTCIFTPELTNVSAKRVKAVPGKIRFDGLDFSGEFSVIACGNSMGFPGERYDFPGCTHHIQTDGYLLFRFAPDSYLLAAGIRCRHFQPEWELYEGKFTLILHADCRSLDPGEKFGGDTFVLIEEKSLYQVMQRYRELIAAWNPRPACTVPTRWKGFGMWWDYTDQQLLEAFQYCKKVYSDDLNIMQVDAGYCVWGDWLDVFPNVFPNGIADFVKKIRQEGAHTGLWAAPCIAEFDSKLFREHPEYFLKKADGTYYVYYTTGKITGILDYSQDEVCRWWEHVLTVMRREWGITYFKLDFINQETLPLAGKNSMTPYERYERFLDITNKVCGSDTYVLGCNAVYSASFGSFDAFRLGADTTPTWQRILGAVRTCAGHAMLHHSAGFGDSDYLELRGPDTPLPVLGHKHGTISMDEAKMWAQFETIFNRITLPADDPHVLEEDRKVLVREVLSTELCDEVFVMDSFCGDNALPPSLYLARRGDRIELHFFNWSTEKQDYRILDADGSEFCSQTLPPHTSVMKPVEDSRSFAELASVLTPDLPKHPRTLFLPEHETFASSGKFFSVPLGPAAKWSITEDREGGMMVHDGLYGTLAKKQELCGIPFDLSADKGIEFYYGSTESIFIPFGKKAQTLYVLHSVMFPTKGELMSFVFHYADETKSEETIMLKEDIGNSNFFYSRPWQGTRGKVAWCNAYTGDVLYAFQWKNPYPDRMIDRLEFTPLRQTGTWNLLGITAEIS